MAEKFPQQQVRQMNMDPNTANAIAAGKANPIVNLQVYQPPKPKEQPMLRTLDPSTFIAPAIQNPFYPPQLPYQFNQSNMGMPYNIIKSYNINVGGPTDDHVKLNMVYEDVLPNKGVTATPTTISERLSLFNYLRSVMFSKGDGQDISLGGDSNNSILSHIKFMDLNPYNIYKYSINPYKGLPKDMLLYRSCYPIRHEPNAGSISCARGSMGMNVRIYKLTVGEYKRGSNYFSYETWRDLAYYEYVREHIIKQKETPNFVSMYGFYLASKSNIDFDKINSIRGIEKEFQSRFHKEIPIKSGITDSSGNPIVPPNNTNGAPVVAPFSFANAKIVNDVKNTIDVPKLDNKQVMYSPFIHPFLNKRPQIMAGGGFKVGSDGKIIADDPSDIPMKFRDEDEQKKATKLVDNPDAYVGNALICLTESPMYNLLEWASKTYTQSGNIKTMIHTGYYSDKIWYSMLFQIMVALFALQKHGIVFNNFKVENNVFVKDLQETGAVTTFWKYKVDGIDYYIPNYGYLVLLDSSYRELDHVPTTIIQTLVANKRIVSKQFEDNINDAELYKRTFEQFKKTFDINIFSDPVFMNNGGCKPSNEVLGFIARIKSKIADDTKYDISTYISDFMGMFMNNRIGTYLKDNEISNIRKDERGFTKGQIIVHEVAANTYKFALFVNDNGNNMSRIYTKLDNTKDIIGKDVSNAILYGYSKMETIVQNFKPNESNLNEDELLETYILNKK